MNRFYTHVSTGPAVGGGWAVLLDGKPIRTPEKSLMSAPTEMLTKAIAEEWEAQDKTVIPETMPLTQLLTTSLDHASQRPDITDAALAYLNSDLLCYRAGEPPALLQEQNKTWTPWLEWFEKNFGTKLQTTFDLKRLDQPESISKDIRRIVDAMTIHTFTVFQNVTARTGSIVIALAFVKGAITPEEAWHCALCEELFYARIHDLERHGLDASEQKRREALIKDLKACAEYLVLSAPTTS